MNYFLVIYSYQTTYTQLDWPEFVDSKNEN